MNLRINLFFGIAACLLVSCASTKKHPQSNPQPQTAATRLRLNKVIMESEWIADASISPKDWNREKGTTKVQLYNVTRGPAGNQEIELEWPFGFGGKTDLDSGAFLLFLHKDKDGHFLKPVFGKTAFKIAQFEGKKNVYDYIPFNTTQEYPEYDTTRMEIKDFSPSPLHPGDTTSLPVYGIDLSEFRTYVKDVLIWNILSDNDSTQYDYIYDNVNFQSNNADILLHYLISSGHLDWIGRFVQEGNDVDFSNHSLYSPLLQCMLVNSTPCMDTLQNYGANTNLVTPDEENAFTPMHVAIALENPKAVRWMRKNGGNIYKADANGVKPLHKAACKDSGILQTVAYANDSLNIKDRNGKTPLDYAKKCGNIKNQEYLEQKIQTAPKPKKYSIVDPALADKPHSGKSLFALKRTVLGQKAAEAMYSMVNLSCVFQAMDLGMEESKASTLCQSLLNNPTEKAGLGPVLIKTLEQKLESNEVDTVLVRYIQMAKGNPYPIWVSKKLIEAGADLFVMRRQFENMVLDAAIKSAIGTE